MKPFFRILLFIALLSLNSFAQQIVVPTDSVQLSNASIWGTISFNGTNFSIITTFSVNGNPHLFFRNLDTSLVEVTSPKQITFDSDASTSKRITDHKHIFLNGNHFVTFSTIGDSDIYIFKLDINGERVGNIVPVEIGTSDRTNDMILVSDGTFLYVGYYRPATQTVIHKFDQSLNEIGSPIVTSNTLPHNNLGNAVFKDGFFYMFTGGNFGKNSSLILTKWNQDWSPAANSPEFLIQSQNGDGNFFSTGIAYDSTSQNWFIAFHHIYASDQNDFEHIDIAVFDNSFKLLELQHITDKQKYRPHLLLHNQKLYMSYDGGGRGVYIRKFAINNPVTSIEDVGSVPTSFELFQNYPNPFNPATIINYQLPKASKVLLKIYDLTGREIKTLVNEEQPAGNYKVNFDASRLASGVYFYRITAGQFVSVKKMILMK